MASAWDWIVAAYERPGVAQACLALQDEYGQNTSLLLWAAWARPNDPQVLERAGRAARAWEETVLGPLRAVRRALKPRLEPVADGPREGLREDVKAAELRAERILVETLEGLGGVSDARIRDAVAAASRAWGHAAPEDALAAFVETLA